MALQPCWRCLMRRSGIQRIFNNLSEANFLHGFPRAAFSTTIFAQANPTKSAKTGHQAPPKRGQTKLVLKKKIPTESKTKPPAPGERKALRKRIVLSNTNALEVPVMEDMTEQNISDARIEGKVMGIPGSTVDQLRAIEAFKPTQSWAMFRRPSTLIRSESLDLARIFREIGSSKTHPQVLKKILVGDRGSGKSLYLMQAMAMAFLKGWIVINIPEAQDLTNAHTDYGPIPNTNPIMYFQKTYTASLLSRIAAANPSLAEMTITQEHTLPIPIQSNLALSRLCALGASDPNISHQIFLALMSELTSVGRPPLLLTLDGLPHIMKNSAYMSATFQPIHAHDLYIPSWFLSHLRGTTALPNGGAVIAASTASNAPRVPTLAFRLKQLEIEQALVKGTLEPQPEDPALPFLLATGQTPDPVPRPDPYFPHDQRVLDAFSIPTDPNSASAGSAVSSVNIEIDRLTGLRKSEAKGLMEYWALSGVLRCQVSEKLVGERWSVAGGGLVGELERGCFGMRA